MWVVLKGLLVVCSEGPDSGCTVPRQKDLAQFVEV
jgi:hypothetical protein